MNYPEEICAPMRAELTDVGFIELKTTDDVTRLLEKKEGTLLLMVNSVCGCEAGNARPAVKAKAYILAGLGATLKAPPLPASSTIVISAVVETLAMPDSALF